MKRDNKFDELRPEYRREDLGRGVRGKHYDDFKNTNNLVLLEPEVAKAFPNEKAVNEALKSLLKSSD